jgi:predicted transglutaminase-like cysteine proteinase
MFSIRKFALALTVGLLAIGSNAHATVPHSDLGTFSSPKSQLQLVDAETDIAPIAFYKFCAKNADQCHSDNGGQKIHIHSDSWMMLYLVNAQINDRIKADANKGAYDWSLNTVHGNCNDYAVQKRKALMDAGFPMAALSLSAVKTNTGEGHLVLTVRTTDGDFVLDNLRQTILPWTSTGYQWISVQSNANPFHWVQVKGAPLIAVASVNKLSGMDRFAGVL